MSALLALMLLTDARRPARTGPGGELIPLAEQDRTRWDRGLIAEGTALLDGTMGDGTPGEYRVQAAIAALHDRARRAADTDWRHILVLYDLLEQLTASPVVTLNKAVALAAVEGPAAGLDLLATVGGQGPLAGHHRVHAVRAHLLEQAGDAEAAVAEYREAAALTTSLPERRYMLSRAGEVRTLAERSTSSVIS